MRVLLVGATGMLGTEIKRILEPSHEVIAASRKGSEVSVDLSDKASIVAVTAPAPVRVPLAAIRPTARRPRLQMQSLLMRSRQIAASNDVAFVPSRNQARSPEVSRERRLGEGAARRLAARLPKCNAFPPHRGPLPQR